MTDYYAKLTGQIRFAGRAHVLFSAQAKGVVVPSHLVGRREVLFLVGNNLPTPIFDLEIREDAISGTFSFAQCAPFFCVIPMHAVFGVEPTVPEPVYGKPGVVLDLVEYRRKRNESK